jgi:hypothetical protein
MAVHLRQSTQRVVRIGMAVAVGDGFTPVTTLSLSGADEAEALREGTATLDISGATFAAVTGADGWYDLTLSTTATNTVGELVIVINDDSLILPIHKTFEVIEEAVYDALFAASAAGYQVPIWSSAGATVNLSATTVATVTTTTTATNVTTVNGLAANVITAAATHSDFGTEIGTAVWASGTRTLTSLSGLTVDTVTTLTNLPAITANWLTAAGTHSDFGTEIGTAVWANGTKTLTSLSGLTVDTVTTLTNLPAITSNWLTAAGTHADFATEIQSGLATAASLATVSTNVDSILVDTGTDIPATIAAVQADLPQRITKNTALAGFPFFVVLTSDHVTGATGKTVTATRSLDGAAFGSCANSVSEIANGWYKIDLAAGDLNGNCVALKFTATDCDARMITLITQPT